MEERPLYTFTDLFKAIRIEDFSSYISKARSAARETMRFWDLWDPFVGNDAFLGFHAAGPPGRRPHGAQRA